MADPTLKTDIFVSLVAPLKNSGATVAAFIASAQALLAAHYTNYEIVLIDRDSQDDTVKQVELALSAHRCVRYLSISGDADVELAVMAGLDAAIGDFVVTMLPGMDPLASIPDMIRVARSGHDVVLGICDDARNKGPLYRALRGVFHAFAQRTMAGKLIPGAAAFRVLSRQAVNAVTQVRTRRRYFTPLLAEIGFKPALFPYRTTGALPEHERHLLSALRQGASLIVHNSNLPLRMVSLLGMAGSLLSISYAVYVVVINLIKSQVMQGWTTLSLQASGLFLLVFLMLALIGEYLARVLEQTTERPLYYVRGEKLSSVMLTDETRTNVSGKSVEEQA